MITIESLTKRYGGFTAVDDVTFTARPGRVTGFLGPNGAGKSTTMRVTVGLTPPTSGSATISGRRFGDLPNPGLEVGVLLDASAQHAGRTGREILTIAQRTLGLPRGRVAQMLATVGLTDEEAGRRVRDYSLGMRQRLGIATALIGDPEVLVLDEPRTVSTRPASAGCATCSGASPTGRHGAALLAPAARDRGDRRRPRGHRRGPGRRRGGQGGPAPGRGHGRAQRSVVRAGAGARAGRSTRSGRPTAPCARPPTARAWARWPWRRASPSAELRSADGGGLEEMSWSSPASHDEKEGSMSTATFEQQADAPPRSA